MISKIIQFVITIPFWRIPAAEALIINFSIDLIDPGFLIFTFIGSWGDFRVNSALKAGCIFCNNMAKGGKGKAKGKAVRPKQVSRSSRAGPVSYTHLTLPTIYSV